MRGSIFRRQVRRTTLISTGSIGVLAGLGLARFGWAVCLCVALISLPMLAMCYRRLMWLAVPAIFVAGLLLGLCRGGDMMASVGIYDQLAGNKVSMEGVVVQDSTYGNKGQIDMMIDQVSIGGKHLPGQVRVTTYDSVEPIQGDRVAVSGKAKPGFGNYQLGMYYAKVSVLSRGNSPVVNLRHNFSSEVRNVISEPQASLGLGFLLGIKSQLPDELNDQLKVAGLTHIVVASGYNLTILVRAARRMLARRSKYQATAAAVVMMAGFVLVTGFSPSMTRAALVTSLSLAAWYYGRVIHPVVLLLFTAALTALLNPLYIWGDLGWYLSFLAFGGVMLGSPLLVKRIFGSRRVPQLAQIGIETLCAQLTTLPLTLFVFGSLSVVSLLANIIVTPVVPLAMLTTFAGGVASVLLPGLGAWLALPAQGVLSYITSIVGWMASIPWAQQSVSLPLAGMIIAYAILLVVGVLMWRKLRFDYLGKNLVE